MTDQLSNYMLELGKNARESARILLRAPDSKKSKMLIFLAQLIEQNKTWLQDKNKKDLDAAKKNQLATPLVDRLTLSNKSIDTMVAGLQQIAQMDDPIGALSETKIRPNGMSVAKMQVPIGVIGIIYESRPNVTIDAAALCLKTGNACILRGGSEAFHTNQALYTLIQQALKQANLPLTAIQVVNTTDRQAVEQLITLTQYVDVIIPRGGKGLLQRLSEQAKVPMIMHLDGNCHMYIDKDANLDMAKNLAIHAKTFRSGICGALETLLIHNTVATHLLPELEQEFQKQNVELRGCSQSQNILKNAKLASEEDWHTEFLGPILAIKIVEDIDEAIEHIATYSSGHTESIITQNIDTARLFQQAVDSASVMVNLPTIFADGFEYGLGAEIGISTNRLHARGPVGLEGLTTYKWVLQGQGQLRN